MSENTLKSKWTKTILGSFIITAIIIIFNLLQVYAGFGDLFEILSTIIPPSLIIFWGVLSGISKDNDQKKTFLSTLIDETPSVLVTSIFFTVFFMCLWMAIMDPIKDKGLVDSMIYYSFKLSPIIIIGVFASFFAGFLPASLVSYLTGKNMK